jgi:hypothetical protein
MRTVERQFDFTNQELQALLAKAEANSLRSLGEFADVIADQIDTGFLPQGIKLPWHKTHDIVRLRKREVSVWAGINGHRKALAVDTPIPTPDGWRLMGGVLPGDKVFDENGVPCNVVAVTEVMFDRECYRLTFSDGTSVIADAGHEWLTDTAQSRQSARNTKKNNRSERPVKKLGTDQSHKRTLPAVRTTQQIAQSLIVSDGCWKGKTEHSVRAAGAAQYPEQDLLVDPYVLGAWLGDGTSAAAQITTADQEILDYIESFGYAITTHKSPYRYGITGGFQSQLRQIGVLRNKHIPRVYLESSASQRLALLQGLMDTDGCINTYGRASFCSTSDVLASQVLELVLSLGIIAKKIEMTAKMNGRAVGPMWEITFTTSLPVVRLSRKAARLRAEVSERTKARFIVKCEPVDSVPVKCIQVDSESRMYLATRAFIPTHNSTLLNQIALWATKEVVVGIASLEMPVENLAMLMATQAAGAKHPTKEYAQKAVGKIGRRMWFYDRLGSVPPLEILGACHAMSQQGCELIVVDSLSMCQVSDDMERERVFMSELTSLAKALSVHIALVHHVRKPQSGGDEYIPTRFDVKGSGAIVDLTQNLFLCWANKAKARVERKEALGMTLNDKEREVLEEADQKLIVAKQRFAEFEGHINLWHHPSRQFTATKRRESVDYLGEK